MDFYGDKKMDSAFGGEELSSLFESAVRNMEAGRFAEALLCLMALREENETPARRFNLALCYMKAEDYQTAVSHLEKALSLTKKASSRGAVRGEAYKTLRTLEVNTEAYLAPMDAVFSQAFPAEAAEDITMALIHGYKKCGLLDKARVLVAGLSGPEFAALREEI
ncbi:MAG: tetratricopeptide repeat protein [Treponema sp.]|jgi:tetratricopeptide (TPR) repeat protein|nr:tetratricopeptide repeat protein [Treponema sp.]